MKEIFPLLIGGLLFFLLAISQLSIAMTGVFSDKAKSVIKNYTTNIFASLLIGILFTILLSSSSALIIIVIVFINSKNLTFKQASGLIMGANIGTTFSSQIMTLDIGLYSVIPFLLGMIIQVIFRNQKWRQYGNIIMHFGMLFLGLYLLQVSVMPLRGNDIFIQWIKSVEGNAFEGALIGGLVTLIIQSSSGTVGMAIALGKQQLLSISGGIAIMLGAELGTCSDTLIATINGSRQALKAGLFHLLFNLTTIILGLLLFTLFVAFVEKMISSNDIGKSIAWAHLLFNSFGVLLFLPFVPILVRLFDRILPERVSSK